MEWTLDQQAGWGSGEIWLIIAILFFNKIRII